MLQRFLADVLGRSSPVQTLIEPPGKNVRRHAGIQNTAATPVKLQFRDAFRLMTPCRWFVMKLLERLDRLVRPIAIPNLTVLIIAGQVLMLIAGSGNPELLTRSMLVWDRVLEGEVWRLVTFLIVPISMSPIWLLFALYIFYLMGTALERIWGVVRYNAFLYLGTVLTLASATIVHDQPITGAFLEGTVFLAFATYNPNFELRLFFVLPVQIKWLALLQALGYAIAFVGGPMPIRVMVLASIGNYLVFFGTRVLDRIRNYKRSVAWKSRQFDPRDAPRHTCRSCGANSNTHPNMDFRYCSTCDDNAAYCEEHLRNHEHVVGG
jgi:hypothetical protein